MNKKFHKISIIIIAVLGLTILGGGVYFVSNKFAEYKFDKLQKEEQQAKEKEQLQNKIASTTEEIGNLKKELLNVKVNEQKKATANSKLSNAEIIAKNKPAVVYIQTPSGSGSGMIIDTGGNILTNAHVIVGVNSAHIKLADGRIIPASVVGRDENLDVALLKIPGADYPYIEFGNSSAVQQGDNVFTLGFPFGLEGEASFKEGTISRRLVSDGANYLEISAEIHSGNSGGPLVNDKGQVIGINTAQYGLGVNGVLIGDTLKLVIPIDDAKSKIALLKTGVESFKWLTARASGIITVFNETTSQQRLIRNTRFESSNGKIFRISQSIYIPGKINGTPGSYEIMVFAENAGSEYNIPPTDFTIPGFKGTPNYNLFYGRSYQSISGGK